MDTVTLIILINSCVSLLWLAVELFRRHTGAAPELPVAMPILVLAFKTLAFDQWLFFRLGAFLAFAVGISECRMFIRIRVSERTLAAGAVTVVTSAGVLLVWIVIAINEHLNLAIS